MIIWLIGLSGSGKTTIGNALFERLKPEYPALVLVDGDRFREVMGNDLGHSYDDRQKNARRFSHFCRWLDEQGIHLICCVLSNFPEWQAWNRETFSRYYEIFLDVPLVELKTRDTKGLYVDAEAGRLGNVVGIDIPFPRPANADLVIDLPMQKKGVDACVDAIIASMPPLA